MVTASLFGVGSTPHPVTVANEGLGWDSLLKMVHNPGGDWNPGWGVDLSYPSLFGVSNMDSGFDWCFLRMSIGLAS